MQVHCILYFHHAGSPNITSLTFNGSSNTLTCTSTGGPATTVTWRRDGVVITLNGTYQQTKRVVDPVEGTYQTVLTINPSVSQSDIFGTYSCKVENARGRSSMTIGESSTPAPWHYGLSSYQHVTIYGNGQRYEIEQVVL